MKLVVFSFLFFTTTLFSIPPRDIPPEHRDAFTMNGQIPVDYWYIDGTYSSDQPVVFSKDMVDNLVKKAKAKKVWYYGHTDTWLYKAIETYVGDFQGKTVGIIGSVTAWYEAIILAYNGKPVTIEYNKIITDHPGIQVMTVEEYKKNPITFDYLLSVSSIEHDGLGRYGDPINPFGDIETMQELTGWLKEEGLFFLSMPVGKDLLVWNAHRIYGLIRLPMLLQSWEVVGSVGHSEKHFLVSDASHQPVFVLKLPKK